MANTDFFDDDLVKTKNSVREAGTKSTRVAAAPTPTPDSIPGKSVSDFNLTRMAQHKKGVDENVADAVHELERLKKRQEELQYQKKDLEDLRTKQTAYESGKREINEHLRQRLVTLEKEEIQAENFTQILISTRKRFRELVTEIENLNEEAWPEGGFRDELNEALTVIDNARIEFNKSTAKIDTLQGATEKKPTNGEPLVFESRPKLQDLEQPFSFWFKVGFAVSIPIILTAIVLTGIYVYLQSIGMI